MAGNMSLLNPFVFNQFGAYSAYAQVSPEVRLLRSFIYNYKTFFRAVEIRTLELITIRLSEKVRLGYVLSKS